jgi:hypothetical protein
MGGRAYRTDGRIPFDPYYEWPAHPRRLLEAVGAVFDANVPVDLALANRCQMLRKAFARRAHIPDRVRGEIMGLAQGREAIRALFEPDWFAVIHRLDEEGRKRAHARQLAWHGPSVIAADPSIDRGEAECHELASRHPGFVVISQDSNAIHHGKIKKVPVYSTPDVLIVFAAQGQCLPENAWTIYTNMVAQDSMTESRYWPLGDDEEDSKALFLLVVDELK